jgi:hypothetical protein
MGSTYYAYMFPGVGQFLQPFDAVRTLANNDFVFDGSIYQATAIDAHGHVEYGDEIELTKMPIGEIEQRLRNVEQFQVQCRNSDIFFAVSFGTRSFNPHVLTIWSRKIFARLPQKLQERYWRLIREVAHACNATYLITIIDPPDYFEDKFLEVDGRRILDRRLSSGNEYEFHSLWIRIDSTDASPDGVSEATTGNVGEGFEEHSLK